MFFIDPEFVTDIFKSLLASENEVINSVIIHYSCLFLNPIKIALPPPTAHLPPVFFMYCHQCFSCFSCFSCIATTHLHLSFWKGMASFFDGIAVVL